MVITYFYWHPDIFGMIIANPDWPEIKNKLLFDQKTIDHSDLVAYVFELKRCALMNDIKKNSIFD